MILTNEQQEILNGSKGDVMAKVMKTLVMYGEAFGAEKLVPITSKYNHLVTSFGLKVMSPVYDLMQTILDAGGRTLLVCNGADMIKNNYSVKRKTLLIINPPVLIVSLVL